MHQDEENILDLQHAGPVERRKDPGSQALLALAREALKETRDLKAQFKYHHATYQEATERAVSKAMADAFPQGDADGHRRHHEAAIKEAEERAEFWKEMRVAGAKWAGAGVLGLLATLIWTGALARLLALIGSTKT